MARETPRVARIRSREAVALNDLIALGYSERRAKEALARSNNDLQRVSYHSSK